MSSEPLHFITFILCIGLAIIFASIGQARIEKGDK